MTWRLLVCAGCGGADLREALREAVPGILVDEVDCLGVCATPVTIAAQGDGRATYVFSGITPADVPDVVTFGAAYAGAPAGWIEDARPLGRLRHCLVTRVPAFSG